MDKHKMERMYVYVCWFYIIFCHSIWFWLCHDKRHNNMPLRWSDVLRLCMCSKWLFICQSGQSNKLKFRCRSKNAKCLWWILMKKNVYDRKRCTRGSYFWLYIKFILKKIRNKKNLFDSKAREIHKATTLTKIIYNIFHIAVSAIKKVRTMHTF